MSKCKWFTIFWLDGTKTNVFGANIEDACNHAGISNDSLSNIDWYDEGIKNTHYYDHSKKEWKKFKDMKIDYSDFMLMSMDDIFKIMKTYNSITVRFKNKDTIVFKQDWGLFDLNDNRSCWVEYIKLSFGKYFKYINSDDSDDEENENHYIMVNSQYFSPSNIAFAIECFINRVKNEPFDYFNSPYIESLEDIHAKQRISFEE